MKFKEKFKDKITIVPKKGLTYLFQEQQKKINQRKNVLQSLQAIEVKLPKKYTMTTICPKCQHILSDSTSEASYFPNRIKTSKSSSFQQVQTPQYSKKQYLLRSTNHKLSSKSYANPQFLSTMLEKHKNLISMIDKRSRYRTIQK